ncbi:TPA: pentapeptide repeat-containing protein [Pasteurella multocida]|nr:pentapeptide repeat-containing protein [Pasteurella multocida]
MNNKHKGLNVEKQSSEKLNTICKKIKTTFEKLNIARIILVLSFAVFSYCILHYLAYSDEPIIDVLKSKIGDSRGLWTLITAIITAPIAFIIWVFRDINAKQQIENQRKDINLKEFQKIAEWVSGLHLIEDEVTEKIVNQTEQEKTRKYTQQSEHLSISTFSKKDGAVGLQIAAIYNLLPFYRGEHGESFKKPALNLLLSAWLALQQEAVRYLENFDVLTNPQEFDDIVEKIQENGRSPIGIAITHVLLADGGEHLVQYPEVFPNLCLAGMDFHLPGLDKNVLSLFINIKGKDCSGINLMAANLNNVRLEGASLYKASLNGARLYRASLEGASLNWASLEEASLEGARLDRASLEEASLEGASLNWASLEGAIFTYNTDSNINWDDLKSKGGVILYFTESKRKNHICMQLAKGENTFSHMVPDNVDIEKTQQENPDWEIFIIK